MTELERLQREYRQSMAAKREALQQAFDALCDEAAAESGVQRLHLLLHRLAGSAGSYGHVEIGDRARALEHAWRDWLESGQVGERPEPWRLCAAQAVAFADLLEAMRALSE